MPETGVQDDNDAGAQMNFKPWIENSMFRENCQSTCLGYWGGVWGKAARISLALLGDFLAYSREGSNTRFMARKKGKNCINWGCSLLPLALPAAPQWQRSAWGSSTARGFPVGHSHLEDGLMQSLQLRLVSVLFTSELAGFVLKACPKASVWMKSFLYSTSIMVGLALPWCISNSRSEKRYIVLGESHLE